MVIGHKTRKAVRYRVLLFALIPLFSLLTLFTPFFTKTTLAVDFNEVLTKAKAWSILNAVLGSAGRMETSLSGDDVNTCNIFGSSDNGSVYVGSHVTGNNSVPEGASWESLQDNTTSLTTALSAVGINGGCRGLLEKMGFTPTDNGGMRGPDYNDNDGGLRDKLRAAVSPPNAFYGKNIGDNGPGDAISYTILYYNLKNVCGWQYRNAYVVNDQADTEEGRRNRTAQANGATGESDGSHYHTYTYEQNKVGDAFLQGSTYFRSGGDVDDVNVGPNPGFGPGNNWVDCADNDANTFGAILQDFPQFAAGFGNLVRPGGDTNPGTCLEKYRDTPTLPADVIAARRSACDEGFKNKTNPTYCAKFSDPALNEACRYGQTTATGGATDTTPPPASEDAKVEDKTSCAIQAIGWIICPVVNFMAAIVDGAYKFVESLLIVQPVLTTGTTSGIYQAWEVMRNFANVAFVSAFLIIIFSQVTSVGITNYGIKKMLPRLIVAAILVNLSYWLCSIAVDISNILGSSLKSLFDGIGLQLSLPNFKSFGATADGWLGIAGVILAGTAITGIALFVQLTALLPILVTALFAIVTVFLVLTLRQALIILLIVVSPLAFVAFLLPNTENMFKKWRDTFQVLLLMYPIISLIFGAAALASKIVMGSASGDYKIVIQIMGAGIAIIPLFITPIVMKVAGGVLNRFGAMVNNPNKGPFDRMRKGAEGLRDREKARRQMRAYNGQSNLPGFLGRVQGSSYRRQARRAAMANQVNNNAQRAQQQYVANQIQNNPQFQASLAGATRTTGHAADDQALARALAAAIEVDVKADIEEVKAASAVIERGNFNEQDLRNLANGGAARDGTDSRTNLALRRAAMQAMVSSNDVRGINDLVDQSRSWDSNDPVHGADNDKMRKTLADSLSASSSRPAYLGHGAIAGIKSGDNTSSATELIEEAIRNNTYSPEKIAKADKNELNVVANVMNSSPNLDPQDVAKIMNNARTATNDPQLSRTLSKNRANVDHIVNGTAPPPVP